MHWQGETESARGPGEPGGPDVVHQEVRLNFDNDNGSPVADFIPQVRDFDAGATANENDLQLLYLADANPPPPISIGTMTRYQVDVTHAGYGRVKIWNRMTKDAAIPLGTWTTAHMETDPTGTLTVMPPLFMEGTVASRRLNDISINVQFEAVVNGQLRVVTCKPILVSVTPILVDMYFSEVVRPSLWVDDEVTTNAMLAENVRAFVEIKAQYIESLVLPGQPPLDYGFIQFVNNVVNGLTDGSAILFENGTSKAIRIREDLPGPNRTWPFLDGLDESPIPFYQDPLKQRPEALPDGTKLISMKDFPGINFLAVMQEINFSMSFRTHFAVMSNDMEVSNRVVFPMAFIDWDCHFWFTSWTAVTGVQENLSTIQIGSLQRSSEVSRLAPTLFNDAIEVS